MVTAARIEVPSQNGFHRAPLKREQAYAAIHRAIVRLELPPAIPIDETALGETPETFTTVEDTEQGTNVDRRFHAGIAEATGNPFLVELVERSRHCSARLAFLFFRYGVYDPVSEQHDRILEALRRGDGDRAAMLMEQHIEVTRQ